MEKDSFQFHNQTISGCQKYQSQHTSAAAIAGLTKMKEEEQFSSFKGSEGDIIGSATWHQRIQGNPITQ